MKFAEFIFVCLSAVVGHHSLVSTVRNYEYIVDVNTCVYYCTLKIIVLTTGNICHFLCGRIFLDWTVNVLEQDDEYSSQRH